MAKSFKESSLTRKMELIGVGGVLCGILLLIIPAVDVPLFALIPDVAYMLVSIGALSWVASYGMRKLSGIFIKSKS